MKSISTILREAPKKDNVVIRFTNKFGIQDEVTITEEQLRYLQVCIAKGEYPYDEVNIVDGDNMISFLPDGRLTESPKTINSLSLNDNLAMELLYVKAGM